MNSSATQQLLSSLNPEQQEGVTLGKVNALINAGAGSGKTKVLTTRISWLYSEAGVRPWEILAVTFTNKAAKEMKERLQFSNFPVDNLWVGTFHGLANRILRTHYQEAGMAKNFAILDDSEQLSFLKKTLKANNLDPKVVGAEKIQKFINSQKERGRRADSSDSRTAEGRMYILYQAALKKEGIADFPELLLGCYELLVKNISIAEHYQERFKHLLVDEFQDTNFLQYSWLKLLAKKGATVFAVGDLDQSIYRFRGAEPKNLQSFLQDFAPVTTINLEQNYRSTGNILSAANSVIANNGKRLEKNLWTAQADGEKITVSQRLNDIDEAEWIAERIQEYVREGSEWRKAAILYRTNAQSRVLEKVLTAKNIPYVMYGGFRFFDRMEVKHAMAYLRLLHNPHDNLAFWRVANTPRRGIGNANLEKLDAISITNNTSLWSGVDLLEGKSKKSLDGFRNTIKEMQKNYLNESLPDQVRGVISDSGLEDMYKADKEFGEERLENLYELISAAVVFIQENKEPDFNDFFANSVLDSDIPSEKRDDKKDAVRLMTVHAAKGLEFNNVFISGMEETLFPHANSMDDDDALEEERRLMYVAITRAKQRLHITYTEERMLHGSWVQLRPSRFIREIPREHKTGWRE